MKLYVNMPTTDEGKKMLNEAIAKVQTTLILKAIDNLNISTQSKKKVLQGVTDELAKRAKQKEISS